MAVVNVMGTTHKLSGSGTGLGSFLLLLLPLTRLLLFPYPQVEMALVTHKFFRFFVYHVQLKVVVVIRFSFW